MQALGKEYRQFGGTYEVVHHTTVLRELMLSGKLRIPAGSAARVAFHDPCYLGRYNDEYEAPRDVLDALGGIQRLEMPRSRDRSFCCGAGGGRMWMEETEGKRINMERTDEALATNPDAIGTGCPFCMTMLTDGVKAREAADRVQVKDVAELVLEALEAGGNR
jgi:Fe-S oxidoreductase